MNDFNVETSVTEQVQKSFSGASDERLKEVLTSLVRHAHAFIRDVGLTESEWDKAVEFLTRVGHKTDDKRQEFILLSDVLGVSMLTIEVNNPAIDNATESTVFGPFFVDDAPEIDNGGDISAGASGEPCWVSGTVSSTDGTRISDARIEVWEADDDGFYDVQYDDGRTAGRAHLHSDAEGRYEFWGVTPTPYPIPADGPVGELLAATGRSPMRAPHLHFMVTAPGFHRLVTHIFVDGALENNRDSVFGVKPSLIKEFRRHNADQPNPTHRTIESTWTAVNFDIVLRPTS